MAYLASYLCSRLQKTSNIEGMEKTSIQYIKEAAKKLMKSKLQRLGAVKTQEILKGVIRTVGLKTMEEAYIFVAQFDLTCRGYPSNMHDLAYYFECSSLDMIEYVSALKSLEHKGYLVRRGRVEGNILRQDYAVSDTVMADVIGNKPIKLGKVKMSKVEMDKYEFCQRIAEKAEDNDIVTEELVLFTEKLENDTPSMPLVKSLKKDVKCITDRILFYAMCYDNYNRDGIGSSGISSTLKNIYSNAGQRILARKAINEEEHILMRLGLIKKDDDDDDNIQLTDTGKEYYYGDDIQAFSKSFKCGDIYTFIENVSKYFHDLKEYNSDRMVNKYFLRKSILQFEMVNNHITKVQNISRLITDEFERVLFYCTGCDVIEDSSSSLSYEIRKIYPRSMRKKILNEFRDGVNRLQTLGLVEIEKRSSLFSEDTHIVMTDEGKRTLLGDDAELYINKVSDKQLLSCDKIVEKPLFFSDALTEQLSLLRNSLDESYYKELYARLEEKHLPKGICVLLYGEPGTGKTESVMQIAKATGHDIMHVDISATKTCWFGESEKLIKKVFTDYRRLCEKCKVKPILLFNEADAVFSKRKDVNSGNVAQTENAIQNIILEEMENLDGILIATTNLADNLDGAFERRFLFKIRYDKPTIEAKINIWRSKLPVLSEEDAKTLAASYEFSGGQIDNIVRKAMMQEIVKGDKPTLNSLIAMCSEEKISKKSHNRIGFC